MNLIKTTIAAAAVIACSLGNEMPAKANMSASINKFCTAVKEANQLGVSGAPGTAMATYAVASQNLSSSDYRMVWMLAKSSNSWACKGIF